MEPKQGKRTPILVARVLVEPKNGRVPVRLLNPSSEPVSLRPKEMHKYYIKDY